MEIYTEITGNLAKKIATYQELGYRMVFEHTDGTDFPPYIAVYDKDGVAHDYIDIQPIEV